FSGERPRVRSLCRWVAAACVLRLAVGAGLFWLNKSGKPAPQVAKHNRYKNEVPAGGNKAVLTLGDGTVINLDSAANGVLTTQGRVRVVKLANGQLSYELEGQADGVVLYNTMRTPRGGEYRLSDRKSTRLNSSHVKSSYA